MALPNRALGSRRLTRTDRMNNRCSANGKGSVLGCRWLTYKRLLGQVLKQASRYLQLNMSSQYFIPDLLLTWPWKRLINPALAEVKNESDAWVKSLALFEPSQLRKFNACDFSMSLASVFF